MKKHLIAALLTLLGTGAFAQTQQGTVVLSGSLSIARQGYGHDIGPEQTKSTKVPVGIYPAAGYFVKDNLEAGTELFLGYTSHSTYSSDASTFPDKYHTYDIGLAPYIRKYWPVANQLYLTGKASASASYNFLKVASPDFESQVMSTGHTLGLSLSPGLTLFATEHISLHGSLGIISYQRYAPNPENGNIVREYRSSNFSFSLLPSTFSLGMSYYIHQ
ncbi:outer membrane beta-barrel protein [Pontibacter sp. 172403-2]|uniref:outer membrane beta-barrel protein n=1 Tax=Pontibacter rufus TaxID=2791028 RepID=UPI0018AFF81E|nr:outer membrane beta-barrel protein [Pontibacter sp. 172403-2]MBF9254442.1 outer membrane beta-barrel protein [Pontibacter sp. 172403-2]